MCFKYFTGDLEEPRVGVTKPHANQALVPDSQRLLKISCCNPEFYTCIQCIYSTPSFQDRMMVIMYKEAKCVLKECLT